MLQVRLELLHGSMKIFQRSIPLLKRSSKCIVEQLPFSIECLSRWRRYRNTGQIRECSPNLLKSLPAIVRCSFCVPLTPWLQPNSISPATGMLFEPSTLIIQHSRPANIAPANASATSRSPRRKPARLTPPTTRKFTGSSQS